jgi:transposase
VRKTKGRVGFAIHARRWMVECVFAWIGRNRGLVKDCEASIASAEAFLYTASIMLLLRRLGRST